MNIYTIVHSTCHGVLRKIGYKLIRTHRYPESTLDLMGLAIACEINKDDNFFFVQIGANDGISNDPLYQYVLDYSLSGLLVEPLPGVFKELVRNYRGYNQLRFENCAISDKDGETIVYRPKGQVADGLEHQKTSLNPQYVKKHHWVREIVEVRVFTLTFESLMRKHRIQNISLLQIDAEGYDFEILKQAFDTGVRPKILHFETSHLSSVNKRACRTFLVKHGYQYAETATDTLAILKSS